MTPRNWLLLFCAYRGAPDGLDPVRLQKGMFLFARTAEVPRREQYIFKPYDYGPMSAAIYRDLDALVAEGLLTKHDVPGKKWSRYAATAEGVASAGRYLQPVADDVTRQAAQRLYEIKQHVANVSFNQLLEGVYKDHPDMAVNSVFYKP